MSVDTKAQLRIAHLGARRALSAETIAAARAAVRAAVLAQFLVEGWRCVAGYLPLRTEPGSLELLSELRGAGARVLVPVLLDDRDLDWAEWAPQGAGAEGPGAEGPGAGGPGAGGPGAGGPGAALGRSAIGDADAVLVPALAVARDGTRLGRGGGSYDRALRRTRPGTPTAALLHTGEFVESLPRQPWDEPVTAVVTPAGWRELG